MASFNDHFSSLDSAVWGSVTSGTGSVSVTDSYVDINCPANSAAFIYYKTKLDKTKSQLWTICINRATSGASGNPGVWLVNGSSAPAAGTAATIDAKTLVARAWGNQTSLAILDWYYTSGGTQTYWGTAAPAWTSSYTTSLNSIMPIRNNDYYVLGIELDGVNSRWRLLGWGKTFATAGTYTFNQGWRLFSITDWIDWSSTRSNSDIWLAIGGMYTNDSSAHDFNLEWVRYSEASAGNTVTDAWVAGKTNLAAAHRIRHVYSYDGLTFLPDDRTTWALNLGAGSPDNSEINEPRVIYDGATTDYMFYTGTTSGTKSICVAKATHVAAGTGQTATFTRGASNPILSLGASGAFDDKQVGFMYVVKDDMERDSAKRWKMLYTGNKNSDDYHRVGYATAPDPPDTGGWTKQGMVLDVGAAASNDEHGVWSPTIVRYGGQWEIWYEGEDASGVRHLMRATGTDLASLTKDGVTYYSAPTSGGNQVLTANLTAAPGRTVTVGSTTGFSVDASVILAQTTDNDTWSTSKIRKITSGTQLELYHGLTGFTTTYPARIKQVDASPNFSPREIIWTGSEWRFFMNLWEPFLNSAESGTYSALLEEAHLFTHSAAAPSGGTPAIQYLQSPMTSRGYNNDEESFENITLLSTPTRASDTASTPRRTARRNQQVRT